MLPKIQHETLSQGIRYCMETFSCLLCSTNKAAVQINIQLNIKMSGYNILAAITGIFTTDNTHYYNHNNY